MNKPGGPEVIVGEAVQWWLEKEASDSTFNKNKGLDALELGREALVNGNDPKINGHLERMDRWLNEYGAPGISTAHAQQLTANVSFGALMFLSGNYRRQRYLQSSDQDDYFRRKLHWDHPGGVAIPDFLPAELGKYNGSAPTDEDVVEQGKRSLKTTEDAFKLIYNRAPYDFDQESSESVDAIRGEQVEWLSFLARALHHASSTRSIPLEKVPILEPKPITEAQPTTLSDVLATKPQSSSPAP